MNINLSIRFNVIDGKVHDDQPEPDRPSVTGKRVLFAKNTNDETTHQTTADKAETTLNGLKK